MSEGNKKFVINSGMIYLCKRLYHYLKPHYKLSFLLQGVTLLCIAYGAIVPPITQSIFDNALGKKNFPLFYSLLAVLFIGLFVFIAGLVVSDILQTLLGTRICDELKKQMFRKIHYLSAENYRQNVPGNLLHRFGEHFETVSYALTQVVLGYFSNVLFTIAAGGILIYLNWQLSIFVFLLMPVIFYAAHKVSELGVRETDMKDDQENALFEMAREDIDLHTPIKMLRLKEARIQQFESGLHQLEKKDFWANFLIASTVTIIKAGIIFLRLVIIILGSYWVFTGYLSFGSFFAFLTMYISFSATINDVVTSYPVLIRASQGMAAIEELALFPTNEEQQKNLPELGRFSKSIKFKHVSFAYTEGQNVLDDINLEIFAGESVGIIGVNGAGKSTLFDLLLRQDKPTAGQIELDGKDIWAYSEDSLLSQFGMVLRHPGLFHISIFDNIRMGKLDATYQDIITAAKAAEIHDEILAFPDGYNTVLNWSEENISAGQMQRIILARALVSNPAILVLDEATSVLDAYNQEAINMTLRQQARLRTTIMVTHHLKETRFLKKIIMLDKGKIAEIGSHDELIQAKGKYYQLWEKQTGVDISADKRQVKIDLDWLRRIPLFETFTDELLHFCAEKFIIEEAKPNQIVFEEKRVGKKFYIIARGRVEISKKLTGKNRKDIAVLENGDYFGEIALLYSRPRTARAMAKEMCSFLVLRQEQFAAVLGKLPQDVRENFLRTAMERLQEL